METTGTSRMGNLAIVGMEACFGPWHGLAAFSSAIFQGKQASQPDPQTGAWSPLLPPLQIDLAELGLSPEAFEALSPIQILALQVTVRALKDAGLSLDFDLPRIGLIAAGFPAEENLAQDVSAHWDFTGPAVTLDGRTEWVSAALDLANGMLGSGQAEVVLLLGVNVAQGAQGSQQPSLSFAQGFQVAPPTSGAAALLLETANRAQECGDRIYAVLEGWSAAGSPGQAFSPSSARQAIQTAQQLAMRKPAEVELLVADARGLAKTGPAEQAALQEAFRSAPLLSTAISASAANLGDAGPATGLANTGLAALAVYHRLIPDVPGWQAPANPEAWSASPFYFPSGSRPWFVRPGQTERVAGVDLSGTDGSFAHLVLSRREDNGQRANPFLCRASVQLFPVSGASQADLLAGIDRLESDLQTGLSITDIAHQAYQRYAADNIAPLALALISGSAEELRREIEFARKGLPRAFEKGTEWQTPLGSYFSPAPLGQDAGIAFVYPGAFNSFIGLGKDLFHLFPAVYPRFARLTQDMGGVLRERALYPRSLQAFEPIQVDELEAALSTDPIAMLTSGSSLAVLYTHVLRYVFGVHPLSAFGYSLGESSMLFALEVWSEGDEGNRALSESPIFHRRLSGPKETVREAWELQNGATDEPLWTNLLLMATPDAVRTAMQGEPHVYLTHVNTPRQVVIAGEPDAVRRVAAKVGSPALQAPFDHVLHCDPVRIEFAGLMCLHDHPVQPNTETALYSAAGYAPVRFDQAEISRDIAETLCSSLDFPRLVHRVYQDGARVFIEVGAGSNCSRWVDEILKGSPHLAISVSRKGSDDLSALLRTLARLVSHRVHADVSPLYSVSAVDTPPSALVRQVNLR